MGSRGPTGSAMRLRITQGMSLEASIKADAAPPMGGWRAGVVIWGNGHSYNLRWFDGGPDSDRIPRKDVRPLPDPKIKLPADLAAGDFVEVRHGGLWKCAEVMGAGGGGQFEVKIVGSTKVLSADRSALRPRMEWGEEKGWVVLHKGNQIPVESAVPPRSITGKNMKGKANGNGGSRFAMLGKTKRSNYAVEADIVRDVKRFQDANKFLAKEEPTARYHGNIEVEVMDVHPSLYLKKRQETSNNKSNNEECDVVVGGTDSDSDSDSDDDSSNTSSDPSSSDGGSDGDSSSSNGSNNDVVGATPTTGQHCQENQEANTGQHCQENQEAATPLSCEEEEQDSDGKTESRASARMRHRPANEEEVVMKQDQQVVEEHDHRVHGLELEAYLSVMKAFHVTGSLTWAKEELLSDLRLHLHVSSDEHLQAIWHLSGKK